jgi:hypothetical protein
MKRKKLRPALEVQRRIEWDLPDHRQAEVYLFDFYPIYPMSTRDPLAALLD